MDLADLLTNVVPTAVVGAAFVLYAARLTAKMRRNDIREGFQDLDQHLVRVDRRVAESELRLSRDPHPPCQANAYELQLLRIELEFSRHQLSYIESIVQKHTHKAKV